MPLSPMLTGSSRARRRAVIRRSVIPLAVLFTAVTFSNGVVARLLPEQIDLTRKQAFTLSPMTRNLLATLRQPVEITLLAPREAKSAGERAFSQAAEMFRELLETYQSHNPALHVRELDPVSSAEGRILLERYPDVSPPCVLVRLTGEDGHEVLHPRNLAEVQSFGADRPPVVEFFGESALTAALVRLSSGQKQTVAYVLTGHGELSLDDDDPESRRGLGVLAAQWHELNIDLRPLDLRIDPHVPVDADLVILAGGDQPLATNEVGALRQYWNHGGRGIVLSDLTFDRRAGKVVATGVEKLLAEFGVTLGNDRIVMQGVTGRVDSVALAQPAAGEHPLVRSLSSGSLALFECRSVRQLIDVSPTAFRSVPLLASHAAPHAWADGDLDSDGEPDPNGKNDLPGPVAMAFAVERQQGELNEPVLVVVGDAEFVNNRALSEPAGRRSSSFALSCLNWLRGRGDLLGDIPARRNEGYQLPGTAGEQRGLVWKSTLFLSALILTVGATVWVGRRQG